MRFFGWLFLCVVILSGMIGTDIGGAQVSRGIGKPLDTGRIDEIVGIKGAGKDGEYKITIPQKDLVVMVDGFRITPPMGLTSWVDFAPMQEDAMVMGDIVLLENEIGPVEKAAIEGGLTVTGLHNHFVRDKEKVMFMHIHGMGPVDRVANVVRAVLDKIKELRRAAPTDAQAPSVPDTIDTRKIESILGYKGESSGGVFQSDDRTARRFAQRPWGRSDEFHGLQYLGSFPGKREQCGSGRGFYDACGGSGAGYRSSCKKRHRSGRGTQSHGYRDPAYILPAFLGRGPGRQPGPGVESRAGPDGKIARNVTLPGMKNDEGQIRPQDP